MCQLKYNFKINCGGYSHHVTQNHLVSLYQTHYPSSSVSYVYSESYSCGNHKCKYGVPEID